MARFEQLTYRGHFFQGIGKRPIILGESPAFLTEQVGGEVQVTAAQGFAGILIEAHRVDVRNPVVPRGDLTEGEAEEIQGVVFSGAPEEKSRPVFESADPEEAEIRSREVPGDAGLLPGLAGAVRKQILHRARPGNPDPIRSPVEDELLVHQFLHGGHFSGDHGFFDEGHEVAQTGSRIGQPGLELGFIQVRRFCGDPVAPGEQEDGESTHQHFDRSLQRREF